MYNNINRYFWYLWFNMAVFIKKKLLNKEQPDYTKELLLNLFVLFYSIYWSYTRGKKIYEGLKNKGYQVFDNNTIYLLLSIFGLNIVVYCLIQNELNTVLSLPIINKEENNENIIYDISSQSIRKEEKESNEELDIKNFKGVRK